MIPIVTNNPRVTAVSCSNPGLQDVVICSIYMPWYNNSDEHLIEYISVIGCLQSVIDRHVGCLFVLGGDFNVEKFCCNSFNGSLQLFCKTNNLCWVEPADDNIHYTYHSDVNDHYSLIDHFLCSPQLVKDVKSTAILTDSINTSDHLAISLSVEAETKCADLPSDKNNCLLLQWEKVDPILYSRTLSGLLSQIKIPVEALSCTVNGCQAHCNDLEAYYLELINCLQLASDETVPKTKVNFHKYWWSEELNQL